MMSGGEKEFKTPKFFNRPEALRPAPLSEKAGRGSKATIEGLDICEGDGLPEINDEYLSMAHRVVLLARDEMTVDTEVNTANLFDDILKNDPAWDGTWDYAVAFFDPKDTPPEKAFTPNSDDQLRQLLTAKDNFRILTKGGGVELKLCRSEDKEHIWVYGENKLLANYCPSNATGYLNVVTGLPPEVTLPKNLIKFLYKSGLTPAEYCLSHGVSSTLFVTRDLDRVLEMLDTIQVSNLYDLKTLSKIRDAFIHALADVTEIKELQKIQKEAAEASGSLWWKIGGPSVALGFASLYVAFKQLKLTETISGLRREPILPALQNMTQEVELGKVGLFSRDMAVYTRQLEAILLKNKLGHPLARAENGVGKTAAYEALAQAIITGLHPDGTPINPRLKGAVMIGVNVQRDVMGKAGSQFRGGVEQTMNQIMEEALAEAEGTQRYSLKQRMKMANRQIAKDASLRLVQILKEARGMGKKTGKLVILFFDEIHTLMKLGKTEGSAGAEQALKPAMARESNLHIAGATTFKEFEEYVARDSAMAGRFQYVDMATPTPELALQQLLDIREGLERQYGKKIPPETLAEIVRLTEPVRETNYPRKAHSLLDYIAQKISQEPSLDTITPEYVRARFEEMHQGSAERAMAEAIRNSRTKKLAPEQELAGCLEALYKDLQKRIGGWDSLNEEVKLKMVQTLKEAWDTVSPEYRKSQFAEGQNYYEIGEKWLDKFAKVAANENGLEVLPVGTKPMPPIGGPAGDPPPDPKSGVGGPPQPPAPPADGSGTAPSEPAKGGPVEGGGRPKPARGLRSRPKSAPRVSVEPGKILERAVGPAMVGTIVGSTVLEHYGVINAGQKQGIDLGMLGGMAAAHPALLWELPVAGPLMAVGHEAVQAGLEKAGVGRETLTSKLSGVAGAFATVEAAAYATGRMAGETGSRALAAGHQMFQNAVREELPRRLNELKFAVTTSVSTGIQNIRAGAQLYGSQIAASGTAAWAAAKSGAASAAMRIAGSPAAAVAARLVVQANAIFGLFMMPEQVDAARPDKTPGNL